VSARSFFSKLFKCKKEYAPGDSMNTLVFGIGILLVILGIVATFVPALTRVINIPGNERIKAIGVIIVGIIFAAVGYFYY
jgi:hypothetical protein